LDANDIYRGKVFTALTLLIINHLSVYTTPYIFCNVLTSLEVNDLSVYVGVIESYRSQ
jgi:hypothetical protein